MREIAPTAPLRLLAQEGDQPHMFQPVSESREATFRTMQGSGRLLDAIHDPKVPRHVQQREVGIDVLVPHLDDEILEVGVEGRDQALAHNPRQCCGGREDLGIVSIPRDRDRCIDQDWDKGTGLD